MQWAIVLLFIVVSGIAFFVGRAYGFNEGYDVGWHDKAAQFERGTEGKKEVESFAEEVHDVEGLKVVPAGIDAPVKESSDITEADFDE